MRRIALPSQLLARKSIDKLIRDSEEPEHALRKTLGPWSLTALGIGAVIGSGIFTVIGTAISGEKFDTTSMVNTPLADFIITHTALAGRPGAGPAIAISLILVAIVCALTGLCYAELASMIPIAGSAYTYTYATLGELIAWIIGWDLILEYAGSIGSGCIPRPYGYRPPICRRVCKTWPATGSTIPAGTSASTFPRSSLFLY
jgi:APA family basic amino acid/polyamine antiporter